MRAAILEAVDKPITIYDDVQAREPLPGEVRVNVKYCGLCSSDLGFVIGKAPMMGPMIPGHEASGVVESIGAGVDHLAVGDPVVLTPAPVCGHCYFCARDEHSLCQNSMGVITSLLPDGTSGFERAGEQVFRGCGMGALSEQVTLPATGAIKIDEDVPLDIACVIGCAVQTGVGAVLNTANVEAGASCVVFGLGGVGMATLQGARIAGASTIIAVDPVTEKFDKAKSFGATHVVDPTSEDLQALVMELTGGIGVDYVFEAAGKASLAQQGIQLSRNGGTTVMIGAPAFEESLNIDNVVLFAALEKKVCGCFLGSSHSQYEIPRLLRLWKQGLLDLEGMISHRRPLAEVNEGFADLEASRGIRTVIEI